MKKLKKYIDNLPIDKLRHRVLGQYLNPVVFMLSIVLLYLVDYFLQIEFFKWLVIPTALVGCWQVHYQIEVWQRKTNSGIYEIADAKAGFSAALGIAVVVLVLQLLTLFC